MSLVEFITMSPQMMKSPGLTDIFFSNKGYSIAIYEDSNSSDFLLKKVDILSLISSKNS